MSMVHRSIYNQSLIFEGPFLYKLRLIGEIMLILICNRWQLYVLLIFTTPLQETKCVLLSISFAVQILAIFSKSSMFEVAQYSYLI